jgi:hypothetical protein
MERQGIIGGTLCGWSSDYGMGGKRMGNRDCASLTFISLYPFRVGYFRGLYSLGNKYKMFLLATRSIPVIRNAVHPEVKHL